MIKPSPSSVVLFSAVRFALALTLVTARAAETPPNLVYILADDIGPGDIGFYHRERTGKEPVIPTPNLDRLVSAGMRFSDAHSSASLCAPTRWSVLTGNYPFRCHKPWGVWGAFEKSGIHPKFRTVGEIAVKAGYATAFFGKWGTGASWPQKGTDKPYTSEGFGADKGMDLGRMLQGQAELGFQYSCTLPSGIQASPFAFYENGTWMPVSSDSTLRYDLTADQINPAGSKKKKKQGKRKAGMGDSHWDPRLAGPMLATKAADYIKRQTRAHPDQPFFIHYCSQAVHVPHTPPVEINGIKIAGTTPSHHGDMIRELDVQVGMIIEALKTHDAYENTLFIFTSDNGGLNIPDTQAAGHDSSHGLRASKGSIYEGGHRVPFIAVWPGRIKPDTSSSELIITHDLTATLYALTNQNQPADQGLDSLNLLPLLTGQADALGHPFLMHQSSKSPISFALREGDWKLILSTEKTKRNPPIGKPIALFNLRENLIEEESKNLINDPAQKRRISTMQARYRQLHASKRTSPLPQRP